MSNSIKVITIHYCVGLIILSYCGRIYAYEKTIGPRPPDDNRWYLVACTLTALITFSIWFQSSLLHWSIEHSQLLFLNEVPGRTLTLENGAEWNWWCLIQTLPAFRYAGNTCWTRAGAVGKSGCGTSDFSSDYLQTGWTRKACGIEFYYLYLVDWLLIDINNVKYICAEGFQSSMSNWLRWL